MESTGTEFIFDLTIESNMGAWNTYMDKDIHKAAMMMPWMSEPELERLAENIKEEGLLDPIVLDPFNDNCILDGRHRYLACKKADIEPKYMYYSGHDGDQMKFVIAKNLHRRHLSQAERAIIATRMITTTKTGPKDKGQVAIKDAADMLSVGKTSVKMAKDVMALGSEDLIKAVKAGKLGLKRAQELALNLSKQEQGEAINVGLLHAFSGLSPKEALDSTLHMDHKQFLTLTEWDALDIMNQVDMIEAAIDSSNGLFAHHPVSANMVGGVASWTWNPITGCLAHCSYCYARDVSNKLLPSKFEPTLWLSRLSAPSKQKPVPFCDHREGTVLLCDSADMFGPWVPDSWIAAVLSVCDQAPSWRFMVTTKYPSRYLAFDIPQNVWCGFTVDRQALADGNMPVAVKLKAERPQVKTWLCAEPLLEGLTFYTGGLSMFDWIYAGGATKTQETPVFVPLFIWLSHIQEFANVAGIDMYCSGNTGLTGNARPSYGPMDKFNVTAVEAPAALKKGVY